MSSIINWDATTDAVVSRAADQTQCIQDSLQPYGLYGLCWYHFDHCFDYVQDNYHDTEDDQQSILGKIVWRDYRLISSSRIYHAGTCAKRNHCDIAMTDKGTLLISIRCIRLAFCFERRPFFGVTRAIPSHPNLIGLWHSSLLLPYGLRVRLWHHSGRRGRSRWWPGSIDARRSHHVDFVMTLWWFHDHVLIAFVMTLWWCCDDFMMTLWWLHDHVLIASVLICDGFMIW